MSPPLPLLKAPFPYFGGKSTIAAQVWRWLGDVPNYIEPFFGSGAVLLGRPNYDPARHLETVNDKDGLVSNTWRALQADPERVAHYADWPANENDLHARHAWLVGQKEALQARLEGDPDWYDAKIAGWWLWGMACWIGAEFCSGKGPWTVQEGQLVRQESDGQGVQRQLLHLRSSGNGVKRRRLHLVHTGRSVQSRGVESLVEWFQALQARLRRVRVCCGDWARICGPSPTIHNGLTGVFLDPPYAHARRDSEIYRLDEDIAADVRAWCLTWGAHPLLRIVLCGYGEEHDALREAGWQVYRWQAHGGYGNQGNGRARDNKRLETCWLSPHCLTAPDPQLALFQEEARVWHT